MPSPSDGPLKRLIREIHRRSLWQVLGIYLIASWGVLSVVDTLGGALNLPEWFPSVALALLVVGLPVVLATAFVQEGGPGRAAEDVEIAGAPTNAPPPGGASGLFTWRNAFGGGVLAFALLGFVGTGWILFGGGLRPAAIEQSIAVLPFEDLSPERDQQYFVEGLSEEIINALSQIPDLKVAARTSTFILAEENANIEMIASALGVANVLEGSVRKSGDQVRINAQLIEAASGFQLWSETFDRELSDIFEIQDEIARAITDQLQVTLSGEQQTQLVAEATGSIEAHEAYLRGRYFWNQRTEERIRSAITEFQRAIDLDPSYAEAYSGLADSYLVLPDYATVTPTTFDPPGIGEGVEAARQAVEHDPNLGMAHASLGNAHGVWGQWETAESEFVRAIELSPGYATAHGWYSLLLTETGRADEAVIAGRRAVAADPVSPVISNQLWWGLFAAKRYEEAVQQGRITIELAPSWASGWRELAEALFAVGEYEEALEARLNRARLMGLDTAVVIGYHEAMTRHAQTGEPQSLSLPADFALPPIELSFIYAGTGQRERALEAFENLVQGRRFDWAARVDAIWTGELLADDPRYQALLEEAGITW